MASLEATFGIDFLKICLAQQYDCEELSRRVMVIELYKYVVCVFWQWASVIL